MVAVVVLYNSIEINPKLFFMKSSGFSGWLMSARLNTKVAFWQWLSSSTKEESVMLLVDFLNVQSRDGFAFLS